VPWLAGIAAAVLVLLAVPVDVAVTARRRERLETRVRVRWLWGLVVLPAPKGGAEKPRRKKSKKRKPRARRASARRALAVLRAKGFARRALHLPRALLRRVHVRAFDIDLRLGLDDPADTGRLWGFIGPATAMLALPPPARVAVTPEFAEPVLHLDARADVRVVPAALLLVLLAFALSPATLRALVAGVRA
jgi:hypothetical protein